MLELDEIIFGVVSVVLEGFIMAIVLKYWEDKVSSNKEIKEITWLIKSFIKDFKANEAEDLYFLVKFASPETKGKLQQVLGMEIGDPKLYDDENAFYLKNGTYTLTLSTVDGVSVLMKDEEAHYLESESGNKILQEEFLKYINERCKDFGLKRVA